MDIFFVRTLRFAEAIAENFSWAPFFMKTVSCFALLRFVFQGIMVLLTSQDRTDIFSTTTFTIPDPLLDQRNFKFV